MSGFNCNTSQFRTVVRDYGRATHLAVADITDRALLHAIVGGKGVKGAVARIPKLKASDIKAELAGGHLAIKIVQIRMRKKGKTVSVDSSGARRPNYRKGQTLRSRAILKNQLDREMGDGPAPSKRSVALDAMGQQQIIRRNAAKLIASRKKSVNYLRSAMIKTAIPFGFTSKFANLNPKSVAADSYGRKARPDSRNPTSISVVFVRAGAEKVLAPAAQAGLEAQIVDMQKYALKKLGGIAAKHSGGKR